MLQQGGGPGQGSHLSANKIFPCCAAHSFCVLPASVARVIHCHWPCAGVRAGGAADPAGFDSSHPVDAAAALEAAMGAAEGAQLAWTVPWVTRYLWFLKWDPEAARAPYFR